MLLMIIAMLIVPGIDGIAKWVSDSLSAGQVTWSRFVFQSLCLLPLALARRHLWARSSLRWNAVRGLLLALTTGLFFFAIKFLPLADAIAIFFVEPLMLTLLSAVLLKESVGWRRYGAVVVGMVGALLIIRPSFAEVGWVAVLPLGAAGCFSLYLLITRRIAGEEDPVNMQFFVGVFGAAFMTGVLALGSVTGWAATTLTSPTPFEWTLLLGLGVIATGGHLLIVYAFQRAPASLLAPFQFVEIVGATLLGFVLFDEFPDAVTCLGIAIIVSSGLYVFHRERVLGLA
ncbi:MAG: EamA family transporter [Gammaproteobacteria bacterium]|nr:EamA family transporter [Gammaproteobacteria bacterium]